MASAPLKTALVLTTVGSEQDAAKLARALVNAGLAACVSLLPGLRSFYRWKGKLQAEREVQLLIKVDRRRLAALQRELERLHPYEVPEILVVSAEARGAYARWVEQVRPGKV